jgi:hypothetical protein
MEYLILDILILGIVLCVCVEKAVEKIVFRRLFW